MKLYEFSSCNIGTFNIEDELERLILFNTLYIKHIIINTLKEFIYALYK